jgi:hypothetical protein
MEKISRTIKTQMVTVTDRENNIIESFPVQRKTEISKETIRAIKRLKRTDIDIKIEEIQKQMEMSLTDFMKYAKEVETETESLIE